MRFAAYATIGLGRASRDLPQRLERSWRAAQDAIEELVSAGIMRQLSDAKGDRLYEVPEVFALLEGFEHQSDRLAALGAAPSDDGDTLALAVTSSRAAAVRRQGAELRRVTAMPVGAATYRLSSVARSGTALARR